MLLRSALILCCLALPAMAEEPIRIKIAFDAKAAAKIAEAKELVEVSTWYEGEPTPAGEPYIIETALVYLGAETYQIFPRDQIITLGGAQAGLPLDLVKEPMLTVNVYTARHVFEDNLLNCDLVSGTLAELAGKTHSLHCKLIGD